MTNSGGGYTRWRDLAVTRWREDSTVRRLGSVLLRPRPRKRAVLVVGIPAERPRSRQLRGDVRAGSRGHPPARRRHRDVHGSDGLAGRRCGDPTRLGDQSLPRDPRARADQLRRGRSRAAGRRPRASCVQQPLHRIDGRAGTRRHHLRQAAARARTPAVSGACAGGARAHRRGHRVRDRSRALHRTRRDGAAAIGADRQRRCPARPARCSIRS